MIQTRGSHNRFEVGSPVISSRECATSEIDVMMWEPESPSIATVFEAKRIRMDLTVLSR